MKKNKRFIGVLIVIAAIISIPAIAMRLSDQVNWSITDFLVMGTLLLVVGLSIELILRKVDQKQSRILLIMVVVTIFLLIWMELAVGILGTRFAGN